MFEFEWDTLSRIPALLLISCVTLGKSLNLSELHPLNGDNRVSTSQGSRKDVNNSNKQVLGMVGLLKKR